MKYPFDIKKNDYFWQRIVPFIIWHWLLLDSSMHINRVIGSRDMYASYIAVIFMMKRFNHVHSRLSEHAKYINVLMIQIWLQHWMIVWGVQIFAFTVAFVVFSAHPWDLSVRNSDSEFYAFNNLSVPIAFLSLCLTIIYMVESSNDLFSGSQQGSEVFILSNIDLIG